jgi:hypothetical protein
MTADALPADDQALSEAIAELSLIVNDCDEFLAVLKTRVQSEADPTRRSILSATTAHVSEFVDLLTFDIDTLIEVLDS